MTEPPAPTMAEACPDVTAKVAEILRHLGYPDLAETLAGQPFHGRCECQPGCSFALTAPPGSSGRFMVWLELDGDIVGEVSLDPNGDRVTNLDIGDPKALGLPPDWRDRAIGR